jgi:H+/Cl- antiporter ClcA
MSVLDRLAVSKDAPVVVPFLLIVTALNWRVLRSLLFPALLLWSAIVGAYLSSFVYFDWFATLDTTPLPGLLDGVAGALLILIVCAAVPTVLAIGLAWVQKHSAPRREVG